MKRTVSFVTLACAFVCIINAQEVVSSAGNTYSGEGYELSWTLGEPVTGTLKEPGHILTQGFHQTNLDVTALDELHLPGFELSVYPNPSHDVVNLKTIGYQHVKFQYKLYGMDGKILFEKTMENNPEEINMLPYAEGSYLLKVTTIKGDPVQTFAIVKK